MCGARMPPPKGGNSINSWRFLHVTATTGPYTLSLHDALPISAGRAVARDPRPARGAAPVPGGRPPPGRRIAARSEEHMSELQSRENLVCRLLLAKKKRRQSYQLRAFSAIECSASAGNLPEGSR